jgi:hypothetical protein
MMYKKIFIMMLLNVLLVSFTIININQNSNRVSVDTNVIELNSLAYAGDYNDFSMSEVTGGAGGGLGLLVVIGIDYIINNLPDKPINIPSDTTNTSFEYVSDVLSTHTLANLNASTLTDEQITGLILTLTGLRIDELTDNNRKSLYLGTLEDQYNQIAQNNGGIAFYTSDSNYANLIEQFGADNLWLINAIVIETAIYNQWDIFLVTNPDLYYNQITKTTIPHQSGRISTYSKELWLINAINNKYWYYNGLYWKVTI